MKHRSVLPLVSLFAVAACGPSLMVNGSARVTVAASARPPSGVQITTEGAQPLIDSNVVAVDMGGRGRAGARPIAVVDAPVPADGDVAVAAGASGAVVDTATVHISLRAHVAIEGIGEMASPTEWTIAGTGLAASGIPSDAVVVGGALELAGGIHVSISMPGAAGIAVGSGIAGGGGIAAGGATTVGVAVGVNGGANGGTVASGRVAGGHGRGRAVVVASGSAPSVRVIVSGSIVVEAPDGRQWMVDVEGGDVDVVNGTVALRTHASVGARIRVRIARQIRGVGGVAISDAVAAPSVQVGAPAAAATGVNVAVDGSAGANANASAARPARHRRALTARERLALRTLVRVSVTARGHHGGGAHGDAAIEPDARGLDAAAHLVEEETVEDPGPPMFYRIPIVGRRIVIAVDVSYSMRDADPSIHSYDGTTPSKLDMLRAQLAKLLGALPPDIAVNIVAFSSEVNALWESPRVLDERSLVQAVEWVARLRPMDETRPLAAVQRAIGMQSDQVIMLTDGRPTYADAEEPALMTTATGLQASVRLDVVGIGPDQNATFLDALAQRGHGIALHF